MPTHKNKISVGPKVAPHVERMENELAELQEKMGKIHQFMKSDAAKKVNPFKLELLGAQYSAMSAYARILNIRLKVEYGEIEKNGK